MKLVSNNIKIKPNTRLSNRTHEILFVFFILFIHCIQWRIEWYQPSICIFLLRREFDKIISKIIQKKGNFYVIFERTSKKVIKTKFPSWEVLLPRHCIQWQIEWYQRGISIFLVCREFNKIISKNIQKIGNFQVIFEITSKNVMKTKFPGWGVLLPRYCIQWQIE